MASLVLIGPVAASANVADATPSWLHTLHDVSQVGIAISLLAALTSLLHRTVQATANERRQLTWVLSGAAALLLGTALYLVYASLPRAPRSGTVWVELLFHAGYMAVPVCAGVAVLKYHLYDADRAVSRAIRLATITVIITAAYVAAVTVIETAAAALAPKPWSGAATSATAFVVVVVALGPLHARVQTLADRLVYGSRVAPYRELWTVIGGMRSFTAPEELLSGVADAAAASVNGTATASVALSEGGDLTVTSHDGARPSVPPTELRAWPIRYGEQTVGRLEIVPSAAGLSSEQQRRFATFVDEAGLAFHNAWLQAELAARAESLVADTLALEESRRRLVRVGYSERDRLSATIQRDVVVHLSGLEVECRRLPELLPEHADEAAGRLEQARAQVHTALDELRALTRGVYPAVLAGRGLTAAVRSAMSEGIAAVQIETHGLVDDLPEELATTAYFATVDTVRDLGGLRRAVLSAEDGRLQIEISGEPRPGSSAGALRDRVEAMGGTLASSEEGALRRLAVSLPLDPRTQSRTLKRTGPT